jgi:U6 snRNA-associated Sm-like protein LSm6
MDFVSASTSAAPVLEEGKAISASISAKRNPSDFLKQVIGKPVVVQLNSGVTYRGILACLDGFMNIAMEQTEEYMDGQLKNKYEDCFIRGNNGKSRWCYNDIVNPFVICVVLYISSAKTKK